MAFRNYCFKNSGKEFSYMIKATQSENRDVGSPSVSEQHEVSSKALVVKEEKPVVQDQDVVDVEGYKGTGGEAGIGKRVSGRRLAGSSGTKRKASDAKSTAPKKGKGSALPPLPCSEGLEDTSEGSGDNIPKRYDDGVFANTPAPAHCHRLMATAFPKGFVKGLDRLPISKLTDLHSQTVTQLAVVDHVLNTKARESDEGLIRCQKEVENLTAKVQAMSMENDKLREESLKVVEESPMVIQMKQEMKKMQESLYAQGEEMSKLRAGKELAEKQLGIAVQECAQQKERIEALSGKCRGLVTQVIPHVCKEHLMSNEVGMLLGDYINASKVMERSTVYEELAGDGLFPLESREDYVADAQQRVEVAGEVFVNATYPYIQQVVSNPDASIEELLALKPAPAAALR